MVVRSSLEIILHVFGNILKGEWRAWPNISDQNE